MSGWDPGGGRSSMVSRRPDGSRGRSGAHVGPIAITPIRAVIGIAFVGSSAFIAYAILIVRDPRQISMLSAGFGVLGLAFVAMALGALIEMWRAATEARTGRAMALAVGGGVAGLIAIGCFTASVLFALLWKG